MNGIENSFHATKQKPVEVVWGIFASSLFQFLFLYTSYCLRCSESVDEIV